MVAVGAAIQGAVLTGEVKDLLLLDVTPLSLGLETKGGVVHQAGRAEHHDPDREEGDLHDRRGQPDRRDGQGLSRASGPMAADNRLLGEFNLEGIPPARMGTPQIEVTFNIDANGILNVTARDKGTGKAQSIKIESSGGLKKDDIERMQRDAEAHAKPGQAEARAGRGPQRAPISASIQLEKLFDENIDNL